jgi:intein-encoded DNA endonuclease-like protein
LHASLIPRETGRPASESYQGTNLDCQIGINKQALELRTRGFTLSEIIKKVFDEFGVRLQKSTVSYWTRGLHNPLGRAHSFSPVPIPELAYVIGVEKGDGSLNIRQMQYSYRIRLQSVDREFVEEFDRCLSKVLNSARHAFWTGAGRREIHVVASSYLLYSFLQRPFEELRPFVEHCAECSAAFLRGFFDSEGCVDKSGSVTASNCDITLLKYVQWLLTKTFGIETTGPRLQSRKGSLITRRGKTYRRNSDCFGIRIRNKFRIQFLKKIGITISRKKNRLGQILKAKENGLQPVRIGANWNSR